MTRYWWEGPVEVRVWQEPDGSWTAEAIPPTPGPYILAAPHLETGRSEQGARVSMRAWVERWRAGKRAARDSANARENATVEEW